MTQPSPAIVAQGAVRRLPRWMLWLFCAAYVLSGFVGRAPWKTLDLSSVGVMAELAQGYSAWLTPTLAGLEPSSDGLLPYWLGAWAMQAAPDAWATLAARLPFVAMLGLSLAGTWYATYHLARRPQAQPVAFAFGGEAQPTDYARAVADGALLALIACLGLAQLGHEATPALAQLCSASWLLYALAAAAYRPRLALLAGALGLLGLTLSGAPAMAVLLGLGAAGLCLAASSGPDVQPAGKLVATGLLLLTLLSAALASSLQLWHWRISVQLHGEDQWRALGRLLLWFTWPSGPLALWTLWRWRRQWLQTRLSGLHLLLPLWFALVAIVTTLVTPYAERSLLLSLPALAALAAFALPTLKRSLAAFIDWFTLIFFSGCGVVIWVVWLSMQTGIPAQPARNVARLAPGFEHQLSAGLLTIAVLATLLWVWLVQWRAGRHRTALWKSAVLPAGGAALCWVLLMSLWLPLLDYARSYTAMVQQAKSLMGPPQACVGMQGLRRSQIAALQVEGGYRLRTINQAQACDWLISAAPGLPKPMQGAQVLPHTEWLLRGRIGHPSDRDDKLFVYQRQAPAASALTR
jgi:4-amino-4-deoxy-L-arabinose transferase-like glycosyltransferase